MPQLYDAFGPRNTQALLPGRDDGVIADFRLDDELKCYYILHDHAGNVVPVQAMGSVQDDALPYLSELYAVTGTAPGRCDDGYDLRGLNGSSHAMAGACMLLPER
jgi:hypothetical protein